MSINEGQSSQLNVEGITTFSWSPTESLSNSSIRNPVASPVVTTLYTVNGEDENGCIGEGSIEVSVKGDAIVNKLSPKNFFSPNNDAYGNQNWVIENITDYPQCGVVIYDDKGVKVYESKPYLNNWDGSTMGGKQLPDGVYYFVVKCDGEENIPKTGSITILR
jgi:gliding motility-associated-like protein